MELRYGPQNPGDNKFKAKARMLQSIYRVYIGEQMGVGPTEHPFSTDKIAFFGNIIMHGFYTGKNFHFPETFEYAKYRVEEMSNGETINRYMLFNNLLSCTSMVFNIFHPLMMIKEKHPEQIAWIIQSMFPEFDIHQVDEILLAFVPTPIKKYINDKRAMDAAILFSDRKNRKHLIAFKVKYTDGLGATVTHDKVGKYNIALDSGLFTDAGLEKVNDTCPHIYCNFLLAEKYRMVHHLEDSYSVVLAPKDHPTTLKEISSLKNHLKREYRYKIQSYTLEDMMDDLYKRCPHDFLDWIGRFKARYLNFETIDMVK